MQIANYRYNFNFGHSFLQKSLMLNWTPVVPYYKQKFTF
jgi:hypothetical protein